MTSCMWCDADAKYGVYDLPNEIFVSYTCGNHLPKTVDSLIRRAGGRVLVRRI